MGTIAKLVSEVEEMDKQGRLDTMRLNVLCDLQGEVVGGDDGGLQEFTIVLPEGVGITPDDRLVEIADKLIKAGH